MSGADPQTSASDPRASVFVSANAGSGKTSTLVKRVARVLLAGARPEAILCVTYTKAAAAEMQRRLFDMLGKWSVMKDDCLAKELAEIGEPGAHLSLARALFARALETPGGLKIQTIHAFCEALLRRFPLEAGVSPGFAVLDGMAAADLSRAARAELAELALASPNGPVGEAYAHLSVELDWRSFEGLLAAFEARRTAIEAYAADCETRGGYMIDVWRRCGFQEVESVEAIEGEALARLRWISWRRARDVLAASRAMTDQQLGELIAAVEPGCGFERVRAVFFTTAGERRARLGTNAVDPAVRSWLKEEQQRCIETCERLKAAKVAEDTVHVLTLARAYGGLYEGAKAARRALDFGDLIARTEELLIRKADAAWVLYKLDGGLDHVLLDEAQDTAPEQWAILGALTDEFFAGAAAAQIRRTVFVVGDEKQSIFSFQGAAPERLAREAQALATRAVESGRTFRQSRLLESWRSTPEILAFVDSVFEDPDARAGITPGEGGNVFRIAPRHVARRTDHGCIDLWPLEIDVPAEEVDPWSPVDSDPPTSAVKRLARRIAIEIRAAVERGDGVGARRDGTRRACAWGDFLILVRRRGALFDEIIRALKREGVPVAGADRLTLTEHGAFDDLMALGRVARFPGDDLTLAGLLRSPFCGVSDESLFDLAYGRHGSLWGALLEREGERPEWTTAADLARWAASHAGASPFDFYSRALQRLDEHGRTMRQRLLTRLGAEAEQAIDAFASQALEAEGRGVRDLERFLASMSGADISIKREQDESREDAGPVRVMTTHGAKGLEAPIVILPDTTTRTTWQGEALMATADGGFLFAPRKRDDCPASADARARRDEAVEQEAARLLYVALTRARDRLIVAGVRTLPQFFERSWRDYVERAFDRLDAHGFTLLDGAHGQRHGDDPIPAAAAEISETSDADLPLFARAPAPRERAPRSASPTALADFEAGAAPSPLALSGGLGRYRRGEIIHRLLERLPDVAPADRSAAAAASLRRERDLTEAQRIEMAAAALSVLEDERFAAVFGPGSQAEVGIAGRPDGLGITVAGRIDRLVVARDRVLIIDFKTNRPAPARIEAADPGYILQLALYVAVLRESYPERPVEAALVWTDGPRLMPVPDEMIDSALGELRRRSGEPVATRSEARPPQMTEDA
ncbi:MAG: double-strand break repair helicase AddA [Caulobacteraceae bacterium]|nr:double-strand break repair helicase AddA [Caulobacteraceae bacterium]